MLIVNVNEKFSMHMKKKGSPDKFGKEKSMEHGCGKAKKPSTN